MPCAIQKFAAVPLIGSTYEWVSSTYNFAKQSHPAIQAVFEIAETGVKNIARSTEPLLDIFEPQLSFANMFACRNLGRLQHKFPIMQQTVDQIMTNAIESIYTKLTEAKDIMDTVLDIGIEAAAESMEVTLCSVRNAVNTLMEINVAQMMSSSVDKMIFKSDDLLEHFLPITDEEFRSGAASLEKQKEEPSYYRRLGSLSIKLCSRAYHHSLIKLKLRAQQTLFQLEQVNSRTLGERQHPCWNMYSKMLNDLLSKYHFWRGMESRALVTSYSVAQKMQEVCQKVLTNMQESLPEHLQQKIQQAQYDLKELKDVLSTATSFQDLPSGFLKEIPKKINKARKAVYEVMEYIAKYTRLSWVDGPYYPVFLGQDLGGRAPREGEKLID
uniref:Perilipin n=1 Tax=Pseudonaja textilis TaxID=8673 RepID=A0A670Y5S8_PSETE